MSEELSTPDQDPASKPQPEATADSAQAESAETEGSDKLKSKDSPEAASQAEGRTRFNIRIGSSRRPKADDETSESDAAEEWATMPITPLEESEKIWNSSVFKRFPV